MIPKLFARLAEALGRPAEARLYLEMFRADHAGQFAVLAFEERPSPPGADALIADLRYLAALGLFPLLWSPSAAVAGELIERAGPLVIEAVETAEAAAALGRDRRLAIASGGSLAGWVKGLGSRKLIMLGHGGLRHPDGRLISLIDATSEYGLLSRPDALAPGHRARLERAFGLLHASGEGVAVALTSPIDLLRELFTVRGAGTLLRRGAAIERLASYAALDTAALAQLYTEAFGRRPRGAVFEREVSGIYIAPDLAGAAVVEPAEPAPYLSKFAVGVAARGAGIGRDLWRALRRDHPRLYWRARPDNAIADWYVGQADGLQRGADWNVYWCGLGGREIGEAIAGAAARPEDFESIVGDAPSPQAGAGDSKTGA